MLFLQDIVYSGCFHFQATVTLQVQIILSKMFFYSCQCRHALKDKKNLGNRFSLFEQTLFFKGDGVQETNWKSQLSPLENNGRQASKCLFIALKVQCHYSLSFSAKRVISFIQQALFSRLVEPLKVPAGMSVMEQELSQICGQFLRLISHNRSVFGNFYADIIGALLKRQQEDLSPRPTQA